MDVQDERCQSCVPTPPWSSPLFVGRRYFLAVDDKPRVHLHFEPNVPGCTDVLNFVWARFGRTRFQIVGRDDNPWNLRLVWHRDDGLQYLEVAIKDRFGNRIYTAGYDFDNGGGRPYANYTQGVFQAHVLLGLVQNSNVYELLKIDQGLRAAVA